MDRAAIRRAADELANFHAHGSLGVHKALELLKPDDVTHMGNVSLPENVKTWPIGNKTQTRTMGHKRRRAAGAVLFDGRGESTANLPQPKRRRVRTYRCDRCAGWADVLLQPVRLRCARCGLEVGHG